MAFDALSLADLLNPDTEDDVATYLFQQLAVEGFPVTDWDEFGAALGLVKVESRAFANLLSLVSKIAAGGLLDSSSGDWLTLLAHNVFETDRALAGFATGQVLLTASPSAGPYTITPGQLWALEPGGLRLNSANPSNVTLPLGGTVAIPFTAESPGTAYNLPLGTAITLATPLPGVTASLLETPVGSGTWLTSPGIDQEKDDPLKTRCRTRWPTLGNGATADAYVNWALTADARVDRVFVDDTNPDGPGSLRVYLAGPTGAVASDVVTAVNAYIQPRVPLTALATVLSATAVPINVAATLYVRSQYLAQVQTQVAAGLLALADSIGIGGTIYLSALYEVLMAPLPAPSADLSPIQAVRNVTLVTPSADVALSAGHVAMITSALTWVTI